MEFPFEFIGMLLFELVLDIALLLLFKIVLDIALLLFEFNVGMFELIVGKMLLEFIDCILTTGALLFTGILLGILFDCPGKTDCNIDRAFC